LATRYIWPSTAKNTLMPSPLQGFGGAKTLEVVEDHSGGTYRAVYTVKFEGRVYVLHCFKKKSRKGIETPKPDMDRIKARLKDAALLHQELTREGT